MPFALSAFADEAGPTCSQQIAALQRAGLHHIDLRGIDGFNIAALPLDHARKIAPQFQAAAIQVAMFGSPLGKIDIADDFNTDVEKLKHMAHLAPLLQCRAIRIFSYYNKAHKPAADFRRESLSRLKQLKTLAQDLGLVLYHENERHIFGDLAADVRIIAEELRDAPAQNAAFKMIFDFGNYNVAGENVWDNWLQLRDTTDAFHFKDNQRNPDGTCRHVPAGEGGGHINEIVADAVQRNFSGPASVEPHLQHSAAVLATGPGGIPNQAYSKMSAADSFQIACHATINALKSAGATID